MSLVLNVCPPNGSCESINVACLTVRIRRYACVDMTRLCCINVISLLCCAAELRALLMGLSVGKSSSGGLEEDISYWMNRFDHDDSGAASARVQGSRKAI